MRLPREVSGVGLANALAAFGHEVTRQTGSHMRLTTSLNGEHHVTIPRHPSLRLGTLNGVLADVAGHLGMSRDELASRLFQR
jgi:predicted RNA binding protein YcfA (HicA-like mRNA interferase family)